MSWGPTMGSGPNHCPICKISWQYCECPELIEETERRRQEHQANEQLKQQEEK